MSTDHQENSIDNQAAAIADYAARNGFEIVETYIDEGKSGLKLDGRDALKRLLDDVESGTAVFQAILVYDVSRFGRFQDPDEAALYEIRCKRAGIRVLYCAEPFENDGSIGSSIIKTVKRAMAGEYSRELSVKVFAGQARLISLGFRQGGPPGFGLRRMLVDQQGEPKGILDCKEHKSIATDRVILVPGPDAEVAIVQQIFVAFARHGRLESEIANDLNRRGVTTDRGRAWTRGTVHQILINEKYVGNNVWARTSFKLKRCRARTPPEEWVRANGAFAAIVDRKLFDQAAEIINARANRLSDEDLLGKLRSILQAGGMLSGLIIDETDGCPSSSSYRSRFGSLLRAYALVGFAPDRDYRFVEINRALRKLHPHIVQEIIAGVVAAGGTIEHDPATDLLRINDEFTVAIVIARQIQTAAGSARWKIRLDSSRAADLTVAVRMASANCDPHDYYLFPRLDIREAVLRLAEHNGLSLDAYRYDSLDAFYDLTRRSRWRQAA